MDTLQTAWDAVWGWEDQVEQWIGTQIDRLLPQAVQMLWELLPLLAAVASAVYLTIAMRQWAQAETDEEETI